ncbi:MAG: aminopeptidase N [Hyphomicrobiaceae bacterium]|nr:aminopeptidase N [Hyphomicrobiaceae bacterium]
MHTDTPRPVLLKNYKPSAYLIDTVHLDFSLHPTATRVASKMRIKLNDNISGKHGALVLDGEQLSLESIAVDGIPIGSRGYRVDDATLTLLKPPTTTFTLEIVTVCNPQANTSLSGLYVSRGIFCTQCEAQGFRRITYFLDRPDVMAKFTVRVEGDREATPVLLSNGNPLERGTLANKSRHYAIWKDPHPKPAYLFALVGGNLKSVASTFRTVSGRTVDLTIYVEPGKEDRCGWAMDSLKRSMRWDEERFGCEYDLDVFNIVAVSDFNMGAMENKGLNVFNDRLVLATPETATDQAFLAIERVIAHEYFHNWTGNRITCRDWFQLCLKEGLTVYRDQEFSSDTHSRGVQRISNVRTLKAAQFPEDAGPLAHPVRPDTYIEINNFYTTTIYEKGAEIVRMIATLLGPKLFRKGMDLYFHRHDGDAATVEQFIACFADVSGRDFSQYMLWYSQAGTPELVCKLKYNAAAKTADMTIEQVLPATPGQARKKPLHMPLKMGLIGSDGMDLPLKLQDQGPVRHGTIELKRRIETFRFTDLKSRPVPSLLRGFSAPVNLTLTQSDDDLALLVARDADPFNRWQAAQDFAMRVLVRATSEFRAGGMPQRPSAYLDSVRAVLVDSSLETAFRAQVLAIPAESDIARVIGTNVDPDAICAASRWLQKQIAVAMSDDLLEQYELHAVSGAYAPTKEQVGARSIRHLALSLLAQRKGEADIRRVVRHYEKAKNLTDEIAGLAVLRLASTSVRSAAFERFFDRWKNDHVVIDHWFSLQAAIPAPGTLALVRKLMKHPLYAMTNPNKVRALVFAFAATPTNFHRADGKGYELVADAIEQLNAVNPQVAARLAGSFRSWRTLEPGRRSMAEKSLRDLAGTKHLSRDVFEIVGKMLD